MLELNADLSTITTIPKLTLDKLDDKREWCICNAVQETLLDKETITYINIGIGTLGIKIEDNTVRYKFTPSSSLEQSIQQTIINKKNPLINNIEQTLATKIINTYKEFFH